jgi:hypothetical protein
VQEGVLKQNITQKFCFSLSLLSLPSHPFSTKGCTGVRRGDSSGFYCHRNLHVAAWGQKKRVAFLQ